MQQNTCIFAQCMMPSADRTTSSPAASLAIALAAAFVKLRDSAPAEKSNCCLLIRA